MILPWFPVLPGGSQSRPVAVIRPQPPVGCADPRRHGGRRRARAAARGRAPRI